MTVVRKDIGLCDNDADVQLDVENVKCICKKGCKQTLANAKIASVSFDVFTRFMMGAVIERIGPVNSDCFLLLWEDILIFFQRAQWRRGQSSTSATCSMPSNVAQTELPH